MSFISSLLCCFGSSSDDHDSSVRARNSNAASKRLAPTQSNIQKSLSASMSERPNAGSKQHASKNKTPGKPLTALKVQVQHQSTTTGSGNTNRASYHASQQAKPTAYETTTVKDSSDSSKDTQSISGHDETTIIEGSETNLDQADPHQQQDNLRSLHDESTGNGADVEHEDEYDLQETELNSISSSSVDYERGEELDLTKFQPGQSFAPSGWLLDLATGELLKRKCLILDLDETLVHSSFKYVRQADFVIPVEIEGQVHSVYVIKRPGVDEFMRKVAQWYEVVVFTASVSRYGDPLLDILDREKTIHHRLFRDSCYNYQGNYIKNLSQIGRDLKNVIIIDNSPASYIFHPQHAVPISSWFSDTHDCELLDILPLLHDLSGIDDVTLSLDINL